MFVVHLLDMDKRLKRHFNKLISYAKLCGITVKSGANLTAGEIDHGTKILHYNSNLSDHKKLSTILHELGHYRDFAIKKPTTKQYLYWQELNKLSADQRKWLYECEVRAWEQARLIAKEFKIPLGKWFYEDRNKSLLTYLSI